MSKRRTLHFALAVVVASVALAFGSAADAAPNPDYTAPPPSSVVHKSTPKPARRVMPARATAPAAPARQQLAITGSDAGQAALIGGVLLALGAGTMVIRRRSLA